MSRFSGTGVFDPEAPDAGRHHEDQDDQVELDAVDDPGHQEPEGGRQQQQQAAQLEPGTGLHRYRTKKPKFNFHSEHIFFSQRESFFATGFEKQFAT